MFKIILKRLSALAICLAVMLTAFPSIVFAEDTLLSVDGDNAVSNTDNAFIDALNGKYGGVSLQSDYGSRELSVSIISRERDKLIIELNGHTLTLGYLAVNTDVEIRGEGTLSVADGIVIYAGELYLADGVRLVTESHVAVSAHGSGTRVRIGDGVIFSGAEDAVAEIGISCLNKDTPVIFDKLPSGSADAEGAFGTDRFRIAYESRRGEYPAVSTASVAVFPTVSDAEEALRLGFISVINPMDGAETEATDDDAFMKISGNTVSVGKSGAALSHANLTLDGALGVNLYFELSGLEDTVSSLGALIYSGVGEGGRIEIPEPNADGKYRFRIPLSLMDMRKNVTVRFEGDESGNSWEYSVEKYARYILSDTEGVFGDAIKDLIAAMLNYGAAMQVLNGETEGLASDILADYDEYGDSGKISAKVSAAVEWLKASGNAYGKVSYADVDAPPVRFELLSLAVNEITAMRIYLEDGGPSEGRYSYSLSYQYQASNGSTYEKTETILADGIAENGYIEIAGIAAGEFDRVFRVTVRDEVSGAVVAFCETTVFRYALGLYESTEAGSAERALAEALIWYGAQSVNYF